MKCSFRKEEVKTNKYGRVIESDRDVPACTTISFGECYSRECAAYNIETNGCKLIERRFPCNECSGG